jgi:hypothetical protein
MQIAVQTGYPYLVAALVGLCFGALLAGAVAFVTYSHTAAAIEWNPKVTAGAPR